MDLKFSDSTIGRFRMVAISEGISFIVLLFIAMPLKYFAGIPEAVKYVGWVHGLLFVLYVYGLITVKINLNWGFKKTLRAFLASLLPFGTFILDKSLQKEEKLFTEQESLSK
ncbi:MAG: DUF3817 domain-containing protein [Bacteroidota bacterium]|nr:DUF3817 domain-containing protein [Bacteroidota bacterium]